jgi:DNA-binding MarR family transcriptional regulator
MKMDTHTKSQSSFVLADVPADQRPSRKLTSETRQLYAITPESVGSDTDLSAADHRVYHFLKRSAGRRGYCFPKQATVAQQCNCSIETVRKAFRKLEAKGYISIERNARGGVRAIRFPSASSVAAQKSEATSAQGAAVAVNKAEGADRYAGLSRFGREYPREVNDRAKQLFLELINTPEKETLLFRNLALWKRSPQWREPQYIQSASKFLEHGDWKIAPRYMNAQPGDPRAITEEMEWRSQQECRELEEALREQYRGEEPLEEAACFELIDALEVRLRTTGGEAVKKSGSHAHEN